MSVVSAAEITGIVFPSAPAGLPAKQKHPPMDFPELVAAEAVRFLECRAVLALHLVFLHITKPRKTKKAKTRIWVIVFSSI